MKFNRYILVLTTLAAAALTGCKNEDLDKHHFDNKFYISSAILNDDLLIKEDEPDYTRTIETRLAQPVEEAVTVTLEAMPQLTADYNMIYRDQAVALPAEYYELPQKQVTIEAGAVSGDPVEVLFKGLNTLDKKTRYVLPVTVTDCNGVDRLDSRCTVYYIVRAGALINVVANIAEMYFTVNWSAEAQQLVKGMKSVTVEALLRSSDWIADRGDPLSTVFGIEGYFLIRVGDSDRPRDQLQMVAPSGGNWPEPNVAPGLPVNEWVHIAIVWDAATGERYYYQNGEQVAYSNAPLSGSVTLTGQSNGCYIGKAWNNERWLPGEISELRIWGVQRTAEEIRDNMYDVSPTTPGLVAYWKFNDGAGSQIKDYAHGTNLTATGGTPEWIPVSLPVIE
ncbi:DUF1735 and LamG domain-containing protein [Alistipes sp.]|uniref:DUF1735 and LamG domain-containing protein n=1 Tax=Alistipes sp. TaxID=1872444 RepID=UPI003AF1A8B4